MISGIIKAFVRAISRSREPLPRPWLFWMSQKPYPTIVHYCTLNSKSLFWLAESVPWILEISACDVISADFTIIMSRSQVIMSSSRFLFVACRRWRSENMTNFFFVQCIIKQLLDVVFVISRIIKVSVMVINLCLRIRQITPTSTSIILDIRLWLCYLRSHSIKYA